MALFHKKEEDWKNELLDEDKAILQDLITSTKRHRYAYSLADDVKVAQLWTALIEMRKELLASTKLVAELQAPWRAIVEVGEEKKRKTIEKLVKEILRGADETSEETTKRIVESLMRF